MNSDKTPDYKGIELKSHRDKRNSKKMYYLPKPQIVELVN